MTAFLEHDQCIRNKMKQTHTHKKTTEKCLVAVGVFSVQYKL